MKIGKNLIIALVAGLVFSAVLIILGPCWPFKYFGLLQTVAYKIVFTPIFFLESVFPPFYNLIHNLMSQDTYAFLSINSLVIWIITAILWTVVFYAFVKIYSMIAKPKSGK